MYFRFILKRCFQNSLSVPRRSGRGTAVVFFVLLVGVQFGVQCRSILAQEIDVMENLAGMPPGRSTSSRSVTAPLPFAAESIAREVPVSRNQASGRFQDRTVQALDSYAPPTDFSSPLPKQTETRSLAVRSDESNPFSSNQVLSIPEPRLPIPPTDAAVSQPSEKIGEALPIRVAAATPRNAGVPENAAPRPENPIDLTPSYAKHLKYVETCGVVVVQADFPLTEIKTILSEIDGLQRDLTLYMGVPQPKEKIELCLFKEEKTYQKFLQSQFPKAPKDRRALYIKLNNEPGTLLVQRTKEFDIDLRHEMTHAIIHASIPTVPIWLDEGLAKYFEVPVEDRSENNPYIKTIRWNVRFGAVPSLRRLERLEFIGEMGSREYRDSWAWVHFMIHHSPETHRLLAGYLQLIYRVQVEATENGRSVSENIDLPSLGPYLNDLVPRPREAYREHFSTWGVSSEEN